MFRLRLLGRLDLVDGDGVPRTSLLNKPKRLALLAYLAATPSPGWQRRNALVALFWPELDEGHARDSLSQAVHQLRRELVSADGSAVVARGSEEIGVNSRVLWCDVAAFQAAVTRGDLREAVDLYRGSLLDGFHVDAAPEFEDWIGRERRRLSLLAAQGARALAIEWYRLKQTNEALTYANRALDIDPFDERTVQLLISLFDQIGDRAGAVALYNDFEERCERELDAMPSAETQALFEQMRTRSIPINPVALSDRPSLREQQPPVSASPNVPQDSLPKGARIKLFSMALAATVLISVVVAASWKRFHWFERRPSTKQLFIVTDFRVVGADSALGWVISDALVSRLDESRFVATVPPARVTAVLRGMRAPARQPLNLSTAQKVAERVTGVTGILDGMVTVRDSQYIIALRVVTADSGTTAVALHSAARRPSDLLESIDKLSLQLRSAVGERLQHVTPTPRIPRITTASLAALRKYSEALRTQGTRAEALALMREAVALDTTCASCWRALAIALINARYPQYVIDSAFRKAYRYRENLYELEEAHLTTEYFIVGPGRDRAKGVEAFARALDRLGWNDPQILNLAIAVGWRREFARAESLIRRRLAQSPKEALTWSFLPRMQFNQGHSQAAESTGKFVYSRFGSMTQRFGIRVVTQFHYHHGDLARYAAALDSNSTTSDVVLRSWMMDRRADLALLQGRLGEYAQRLAELRRFEESRGAASPVIGDSIRLAEVDAIWPQRRQQAVRRLDKAVASAEFATMHPSLRPYLQVAAAYAMAARTDRARAILRRYDREMEDTSLKRASQTALQGVLGEIALAEKRPHDAVEYFRRADLLPDGPVDDCTNCLFFNLGRAFDCAADVDSAISYYERFLTTPHFDRMFYPNDPLKLPWTLSRLARLHQSKGHNTEAARYSARLAELWANADPVLQSYVSNARRRR